jgi:hypothetical protein
MEWNWEKGNNGTGEAKQSKLDNNLLLWSPASLSELSFTDNHST